MTAPIIIDVTDGVLSITWNYPERLNALRTEMLSAAADAIETAPDNVRVIVMCGAGRVFSSGGDVRELNAETIESGHRLVRAITRARHPVIGGVNGPAVGIGCSIAVAADLTLAKRSSYFLMPFVSLGLMPDGGSTELLAASIGRARALEMVILGERLSADDAVKSGLIYRSVPDDSFDHELRLLVNKVRNGPTQALAAAKKAIAATTLSHLDEALDRESATQLGLLETSDGREGRRAFLEKRKTVFVGQ
jgi:enoyl-CoA hydratase/carnithine racemase